MKNIFALTVAVCMAGSGAIGATLDFVGEANSNERGEASGYVLNSQYTDFTNVTITSNYNPYFDSSFAGLGVCMNLDAAAQCDPSNDDNVTTGEWVALAFDGLVDLTGLLFRDKDHVPINASTDTLLIGIDGGVASEMTFANAAAATFKGITSIMFEYGGTSPDQFYISGATATPVPVPASLPLLAGGLGIAGWFARRRKKS